MMADFDAEFDVPFEWLVAELARSVDGQVTFDVPGVPLDEAFKAEVEKHVTDLARSVSQGERIADVFRLVVSPEGEYIEIQMLDVGFSIVTHPRAFGLPSASDEGNER